MELEISGETLTNTITDLQHKYTKMKCSQRDSTVETTVVKEMLSEKEHQHETMLTDYNRAIENERNVS